jgi:opacity protein-like surface antigen
MTRLPQLVMAMVVGSAAGASAQVRPYAPLPQEAPAFTVRLYGEGGLDRFAAGRTFNAIFGEDSGPVYGGGAEVVLRSHWFVRVAAWRFRQVGERAVRLENQTYRLGIPLTVTILPVEVSGGYRFPLGRAKRFVPYVGGGISSNSYTETSPFAEGDENVKDRFTGYQLLGGAEFRLHPLIGVAGEVQYSTVPDALGTGGLSAAFSETDLGGLIVRARVLFGR